MFAYVMDFADVRLTMTPGQIAEMLQAVNTYESLFTLQ